ncbi:MAG TPA: DUF167 family protein [Candidatus Limnocylindrales bacterium]
MDGHGRPVADDRHLRSHVRPPCGGSLTARSRPEASAVRFSVRLTPRGGVDRVDGVVEGTLRVRVAAAAADDAANRALLRLLAAELELPRAAIRLVAGATSRRKLVVVEGVTPQRLLDRWPGLRV